jgi:CarD family transcriptional regulator
VAEKTRHRRSKKSAAGMSRKARKPTSGASRRPSQSPRRTTRGRVGVAKPAHRRKPEAEGATLGMTAKKTTQRQGFKTSEFIVYPAHGVGQIVAIEEQEVAGVRLELFVISFVKDKMTLRVPTSKIASVGMRKLAETPMVKRALETLKGRARIKRTMWSRRAQEYEAKINSGDIVAIAEVVRDLFRSESQPEQSYSERQLYEAAIDRLSREVAAVQRLTETEAVKEIEAALAKGPHRGPKPDVEEDAVVEEEAA